MLSADQAHSPGFRDWPPRFSPDRRSRSRTWQQLPRRFPRQLRRTRIEASDPNSCRNLGTRQSPCASTACGTGSGHEARRRRGHRPWRYPSRVRRWGLLPPMPSDKPPNNQDLHCNAHDPEGGVEKYSGGVDRGSVSEGVPVSETLATAWNSRQWLSRNDPQGPRRSKARP
jgi:hypothetical protein